METRGVAQAAETAYQGEALIAGWLLRAPYGQRLGMPCCSSSIAALPTLLRDPGGNDGYLARIQRPYS